MKGVILHDWQAKGYSNTVGNVTTSTGSTWYIQILIKNDHYSFVLNYFT